MPRPPWEEHQLVFVGGMHRSGTTLLAEAISASAESSGLTGTGVQMNEGQFLQDVYLPGYRMGGTNRWAFDPRAHLTEADAAEPEALATRLWSAWSPHWDLEATTLVEKTPLNLAKTRFLQAIFPDASFVIITRHPVTQSLAVKKWAPRRLEKLGHRFARLVEHWAVAHEHFAADAPSLRRLLVVRYEDLARDPIGEADRIESFLGRSVDRAQFERYDAERALAYSRDWEQLRAGSRVSGAGRRAERPLLRRELPAVERLRPRIGPLGYDLDVTDAAI